MDDLLLLAPGSRFLPLGEVAGLVLGSSRITPVSGRLPVALINMVQQQSVSAAGCVRELQSCYPVPYLLMELDRLKRDGVFTSRQRVEEEYVLLQHLTIADEKYVVDQVDGNALVAALSSWRNTMATGKCWVPVITGNGYTTIGPVFHSDSPFCPQCMFARIDRYVKEGEEDISVIAPVAPELGAAVQEALLHLVAAPHTGEYFHVGEQYGLHQYQLQRRPECTICGDPGLVARLMQAPVTLTDTRTAYRAAPPAVTWEKWSHHINPVMGIVRHFEKIGDYTWRALLPDAAPFTFLRAYGKGYTETAAMVSCLCEAIERWSACWRGDEPLLLATVAELQPYTVSPAAVQHFAPQQLQWPEDTPALGPVPDTLVVNRWLPAWSLTHQERRYVPADMVLYNLPVTGDGRAAVFDSNGMAAGSTMPEAILQGLLELIERDAVAIWWFNRLQRPEVPLALMQDHEWWQQQWERLMVAGWQVQLLDLTIDTGVYVIAAVGEYAGAYLTGYGCHYSLKEAMLRAFTELIQIQAIMAPVRPPEGLETDYLRSHAAAKRFDAAVVKGTAEEMCAQLIAGLQTIQIETIVVDCTRPDAGLPVVKVLAPGLRAFRPRFGAGRLYEVPVALGLREEVQAYQALTPMWLVPSQGNTAK